MNNKIIVQILTYLGAIPFISCIILKIAETNLLFNLRIDFILISYSVVILSFVTGLNFSYGLKQNHYAHYFLFISNLIALLACYNLLIQNYIFSYTIISIAFLSCLILDYLAYKTKIIQFWFYKLRLKITILVLLCLIMNIIFLNIA